MVLLSLHYLTNLKTCAVANILGYTFDFTIVFFFYFNQNIKKKFLTLLWLVTLTLLGYEFYLFISES